MKDRSERKERGSVAVEAVFILPIAILSVVLLLYLSLFMYQRANLQAGLETTLVYYKNTLTDSYVTKNNTLTYEMADNSTMGKGNSYQAQEPLNPYRGMFGDQYGIESTEDFETYFESVTGKMLFSDNLIFSVDYTNYLVLKQIEVSVTQKIKTPIDFHILGIGNEFEISASAKVNVINHEEMIRNVDYAIDLLEDTKAGEIYNNISTKISQGYSKMKKVLTGE